MDTTAILARTNRALMLYEQALTEANVPYRLIGKAGYWAQPEIKAALSYLQCALYPADYALAGALRAPFWPTKFLPKTKIAESFKKLQGDDKTPSYWQLLSAHARSLVEPKNLSALQDFVQFVHSLSRYKDLPAGDATKQILTSLKAFDYYSEEEDPDNDPVENLIQLIKTAGRHSSIKEFLDYARRVTAASKSKKGVALGTLHGAKGLEFHTVYFVGCQDGLVPHAKSTDIDSERNCFFVGASRAERELVITYAGKPSPFLDGFLKGRNETQV